MQLKSYFDEPASPTLAPNGAAQVWGVQALCLAVADQLQARFNPVTVRGEISGFSRAASGHCYFSLQDESGQALLRCAMFKRAASSLNFTLRNGLQVQVRGKLGVYEARGDLQLVVEHAALAGEGALMERFMALKAKLAEQGLFAPERKRSIPRSPKRIGVVTSLGAAALQDVCTALGRRVAHIPVLIAPALVQGPEAAGQLVAALERLQKEPDVEVILLVRGGGSMEDLWAFNEEPLVHAVAQSRIPIICGVGHETDFTLCDFAADLRAPTPTAAAELCATARHEWLSAHAYYAQHIPATVANRLQKMQQELDYLALSLRQPSHFVTQWKGQLDALSQRFSTQRGNALVKQRGVLDVLEARLESLSPQRVLERGYALITNTEGEVLSRTADLEGLERLRLHLQDGQVEVGLTNAI